MKILAYSAIISIILVLFIFKSIEPIKYSALSFTLLRFIISFRLKSILFLFFKLEILL